MEGMVQGLNTWFGVDNTAAVSWKRKRSARAKAKSYFAPQVLRAEALLQRFTRRGPQDIDHIDGATNLLGDFSSLSHEQGFAEGETGDQVFFEEFTNRHPLPPQLEQWQLVHPPKEIISVVYSMLRNPQLLAGLSTTGTGNTGLSLPSVLANTLYCPTVRVPSTTWNEQCCSWPLLSHIGKVDTTLVFRLRERRSIGRFANAHNSWSPMDLMILEKQLRATTSSTKQ
jgi:hypothetical protein